MLTLNTVSMKLKFSSQIHFLFLRDSSAIFSDEYKLFGLAFLKLKREFKAQLSLQCPLLVEP